MYELEDYRWKTFGQAKEATDNVSEWLFGHGLEPGDCMLIYAKTRPEWIQMALGKKKYVTKKSTAMIS